MAGRHHVEPLERVGLFAGAGFVEKFVGVGELRGELRDELSADFVTARADAGTNGGEEIGRIRAVIRMEFADGFFEDANERSTPTGVNSGDGAFFGIDEQNGNAVGGLDGEEKSGSFGERGVAFAGLFRRRFERPDDCGMDLFESDKREFLGAEGSLKFLAVFEEVFAGVPFGEAEVQDFAAVEIGHAAGSSTEAVDEPG